MKLWLDDDVESGDRNPPEKGWLWATDVGMAIQIILAFKAVGIEWEEASLDHDLGDHPQGDGIKLIHWMIETENWPRERPVVHSANIVGKRNMEALIDRYGNYE